MNTESGEAERATGTMGTVFREVGLPSFFLGAVGLYVLWLLVQSIILAGWWEPGNLREAWGADLAGLGVYVAFAGAAAVQFLRRKTRVSQLWAPDAGESPLAWNWSLGLTLAMLVSAMVVAVADDGIRAAWFPQWRERSAELNFGSPLMWIVVVLWAPAVEELVFRGYLLHRWARRWGASAALVATSVLFALLHPNPIGHFFGALLLGLVTLKTGSLVAAVGIHLGNNLLAMLIGLAAQRLEPDAAEEALTGTELSVAVALALVVMGFLGWGLAKYWPRKGHRVVVVEEWKEKSNTENGEAGEEG